MFAEATGSCTAPTIRSCRIRCGIEIAADRAAHLVASLAHRIREFRLRDLVAADGRDRALAGAPRK
jgi:hypothetical protein